METMIKNMLATLHERKWVTAFGVYDRNNNGTLEKQDFEELVQKLGKLRGWESDSSGYKNLYNCYLAYWDEVRNHADKNQDGKVTLEEWVEYHRTLLDVEHKYEVIEAFSHEVFHVFNPEGKETSAKEWEEFFGIYNIPLIYAKYVFPYLDINGNGTLSKEEVLKLHRDFYLSDDPDAPGNLFFGPHL